MVDNEYNSKKKVNLLSNTNTHDMNVYLLMSVPVMTVSLNNDP